jgi:hypothetical protein
LGTDDFSIGSRNSRNADFIDSYPDTTWGDPGTSMSARCIKESIDEWRISRTIKLSNLMENWKYFINRLNTPKNKDLYRILFDAKRDVDELGTDKFILINAILAYFDRLSKYFAYTSEELSALKELISTDIQAVSAKLLILWK